MNLLYPAKERKMTDFIKQKKEEQKIREQKNALKKELQEKNRLEAEI